MTCQSFREYLGAFADGELDPEANAQALEHVNICPSCAQRVTEIQRMKKAVRRVFEGASAPPHLAEKVRSIIRAEAASPPKASRSVIHRLIIPTGMAAAILAAVAVWLLLPEPPADGPGVQATFASQVRHQHQMCCDHQGPHDATLGRELAVIAENLAARLNVKAIAPDLADRGFTFRSAHVCDIQGRRCGHVMYQAADGPMLSVFSLAAADCKDVDFGTGAGDQGGDWPVEQRGKPTMIGWAVEPTAYILCAEADKRGLSELAQHIRQISE